MNKLNIDLKKRLGTGLKKAVSLTLAAMLVVTSVNVVAKADSQDIQLQAKEIYLKGDDTNKLGTFQYGSASETITKIVFEVNEEAKKKIGNQALCLFGENHSDNDKVSKNGDTYTFENLNVNVENNIHGTEGSKPPKLIIKLGFNNGAYQAEIEIFDEVKKCDISTLLNGNENPKVITTELPYNNKNEYIVSVGLPSYKEETNAGQKTTYKLQGYQDGGIYIKAKCAVTDNKVGDGEVISIKEFVPVTSEGTVNVGGTLASSLYNLDEEKTKEALNSKNLKIKIIKKDIKADDYDKINVNVEQFIEAKDSKELKKKVNALTEAALTKAVRDKVKSQFDLSQKGSISFEVGSDKNAGLAAVKTELEKVELEAEPQEKEYSYTYTVDNDEENYSGSIKGKVKFTIKKANASNPSVPGPQGPKQPSQPNNKQSNNTGSIISPIVDSKQDKQNSKPEQKSDNKDKKSMMATEDSKINLKAKTRITRSKANITVSNKALKEAVMGSESADVYISDKSKANTVKLMLTKSNVKTLLDSEVNSITLKNNLMDFSINGDSLFKLLSDAKNGLQISISKKANTYQLKVADKNNKPIATKGLLLVEIPAKGDKKLYVIENGKKIKVKSSFDSKNKVIKANIKTNSKFILK